MVSETVVHFPVMVEEVIKILVWKEDGVYFDGTVGEGGHARALLERFPRLKIIGLDWDEEILKVAEDNLREFHDRVILKQANYREVKKVMKTLGKEKFSGVFLDLGLSSFHLERSGRGFSFQRDEFLDMRFSKETSLTAYDILNRSSLEELVRIFEEFGEERKAQAIAEAIVKERKKGEIHSTAELREIIWKVYGGRRGKKDPATLVFQALRIAVNKELENLKGFLDDFLEILEPGGRAVIISYHSLEDRLVKRKFLEYSKKKFVNILTPKPLLPSSLEVAINPASRSAKLRGVEKI